MLHTPSRVSDDEDDQEDKRWRTTARDPFNIQLSSSTTL
jgi:hypothetical protein